MNETSSEYGYWLPPDLSAHGASIDQLINVLHYFMVILFIGWGIFLIYCLIKFRAREGHQAVSANRHFKIPTYIEIGVAIFEVVLLIWIAYPKWAEYKTPLASDVDATRVKLVAEQFAWNFHYPGRDGIFGRTSVEFIDAADNPVGLDRDNDPNAKDDIVSINNLHIIEGKPVSIEISSKDVIHSFYIPVLRVKQDAVPGMTFPVHFTAVERGKGDYPIQCAQLCGVGHYRMAGRVFIDTPEMFESWMQEEEEFLEEDEEEEDE